MAAAPASSARSWAVYTVLRLVFFAVPLLVIWGFSGDLTISAVLAAVIGLCLSVVLLDRQRGAVAVRLESWATRRRSRSDEAAEDLAADGEGPGQSSEIAPARPKP